MFWPHVGSGRNPSNSACCNNDCAGLSRTTPDLVFLKGSTRSSQSQSFLNSQESTLDLPLSLFGIVHLPFNMPSAYHVLQGPPTSPTDQRSPPLRPGDVCVGCIVWLPPKRSQEGPILCNRHGCCGGAALKDKGYNHPVVVLRIQQAANSRKQGDLIFTIACVRIMHQISTFKLIVLQATSFDDTTLSIYQERRLRDLRCQESIQILDSTSSTFQDDSRHLKHLVLEKRNLRKQSYIRLDHTYEVAVDMLTQYYKHEFRAYKLRLSEESYSLLMKDFGLVPEFYEETNTLFETEARRLAALANPVPHAQNTTLPPSSIGESPRIIFPPVIQAPLNQLPVFQSNSAHIWQPTPPVVRYGYTSSQISTVSSTFIFRQVAILEHA